MNLKFLIGFQLFIMGLDFNLDHQVFYHKLFSLMYHK